MLSSAVLVLAASMVVGQSEQPAPFHKELKVFQPYIGEWVCELSAEEDVPGLIQKGEKIKVYLAFAWARNGNAVSGELRIVGKGGGLNW